MSAEESRRHSPDSLARTRRSFRSRTNSSAYNGLPPERSRMARSTSAGRTACSRRFEISRVVSASESGVRLMVMRLRSLPLQLTRAWSSGRAVPMSKSGTPSANSATCSMNSRRASSAQCRSSNTATSGPSSARSSRYRRHPVKFSSRAASGASSPTSGLSRCLSHGASVISSETRASILCAAVAGSSLSRMPASALHDLAERPERDAVAVREAPTRAASVREPPAGHRCRNTTR